MAAVPVQMSLNFKIISYDKQQVVYSLLLALSVPAAVPIALLFASTPLETLETAILGTMGGFHIQLAPSTTSVSPVINLKGTGSDLQPD